MRSSLTLAVTLLATLSFSSSAISDSTVVVDQAKQNGIVTCVEPLDNVANFIIGDRRHGSHSTWNNNNANERIFTSMTAKHYSDGDGHVTIVAAPVGDGKCDTTYIETYALERTCISARESLYSDWTFTGELVGTIVLENEAGTVNLYLTSQGSGNICLVSRRETVYN